jgi:hypothetical protein
MPAAVLYWVSLVLGCLAAFPSAYFGFCYLTPRGGPLHQFFKGYYADVVGPFVGWKGDVLRSTIGPAQIVAGVGIIIALWGTCLKIITGEFGAWVNALLLCALHGMIVVDGVGAVIEGAIGNIGALVPATILMTMFSISYACRLAITPLAGPQRLFYFAFVLLTGILMLASLITRFLYGLPVADAKKLLEGPDGYIQKSDDAFAGKEVSADDGANKSLVPPADA